VPATGLVALWLRITRFLAVPLARMGATANALSVSGVVLAALAVAAASTQLPGRLALAAVLIGTSGLADGLDGALATVTQTAGRRGAVLDAVCDRISDVLFAAAFWLAGAGGLLCSAVAVAFLLHEYIRAAARGAGLEEVTVITLSERPTRVIVVAAFLLGAGTAPDWLGSPDLWLNLGAWSALGVSVIGIGQLSRWLYRAL
jgi:CDP-diacylglycerol--glycerol-3-phosphate 3-phosphatidyltransferase